jgi:hypothetical protein
MTRGVRPLHPPVSFAAYSFVERSELRNIMKYSAFGSLFILLSFAVANAQQISDRERDGLIGPVSSVTTYRAHASIESGRLVEGAKSYLGFCDYDRSGKKVTGRTDPKYFLNCYNNVERIISYDANGNKTETFVLTDRHSGNPRGKWVDISNTKGLIIETLIYNAKGKLSWKCSNRYDEYGHLIEILCYKGDEPVSRYTSTYEFDTRGNWTKQVELKWPLKSDKAEAESAIINYREIFYYE